MASKVRKKSRKRKNSSSNVPELVRMNSDEFRKRAAHTLGLTLENRGRQMFLEKSGLRRRSHAKSPQKGRVSRHTAKNKSKQIRRNHNALKNLHMVHSFAQPPSANRPKLKMEGGGDNQYYMPADEQTGSAQGNLNASLNEQKGRNQGGGGSVPTGFIPPAGMSGNDVASLKSTADITEQGKASAVGDGDIPQKPCGENAAIGGRRRKKRRTKKKRKRRKSRRKSRRKKRRTRRRRKNLKLLRFSKMPPKYL